MISVVEGGDDLSFRSTQVVAPRESLSSIVEIVSRPLSESRRLCSSLPKIAMPALKIKAAAVHAAPVYMNKADTLKKVASFIENAERCVDYLVFPETFVPGYPVGGVSQVTIAHKVDIK